MKEERALKVSNRARPQRKCSPGKVIAWGLPLVICVCVNLVYMTVSYFPNHAYLEWAALRLGNCSVGHLPDLVLDLHGMNEPNWLTQVGDALPGILMVVGVALCGYSCNLTLWALFFNTQSFIIALNCAVEQVTMMPSSYGYKRCLTYMGIHGPAEDKFSLNPAGSCAAMLWSGHTFHTLLGIFTICTALSEGWKMKVLTAPTCGNGPEVRTWLMLLGAFVIAVLLLANKGHYTVDILLATIVTILALTNDSLTRYLTICGTAERCGAEGEAAEEEADSDDSSSG